MKILSRINMVHDIYIKLARVWANFTNSIQSNTKRWIIPKIQGFWSGVVPLYYQYKVFKIILNIQMTKIKYL